MGSEPIPFTSIIFTLLTVTLTCGTALAYNTSGGGLESLTTLSSGGTNVTSTDHSSLTSVSQPAIGNLSGEFRTGVGYIYLLEEEVSPTKMQVKITKLVNPFVILARENETIEINLTVKLNQTENPVCIINITDQVPWDFTPPGESEVRLYFVDYSPYSLVDITTNQTVNISVVDQAGSLPTLLMVNISNISLTDAGSCLLVNDSIRVEYRMVSSQMEPNEFRDSYTNATVRDNTTSTGWGYILTRINASEVVLRGYKKVWSPDLWNPQNIHSEIIIEAIGGPLSEIYVADYLPQGATILSLNVTFHNHSSEEVYELWNSSDYYVEGPFQDVLPDGTYADVYLYNFTYNFTNWTGSLSDRDYIRMFLNITVLGGGQWVLPALIAGFDPIYQKHIQTETYAEARIPLFDVEVNLLSSILKPGETLVAILKILNVAGPRAQIDMAATYSVKTMEGEMLTEATDTFAVLDQKEKELSLALPSDIRSGKYTFETLITYTGREAISTRAFEVVGAAASTGVDIISQYGVFILLVLLVAPLYVMYLRSKARK
jgi:hypothetical protein